MWNTINSRKYGVPTPQTFTSTTLTTPGLAPTLIELISANNAGDGMPKCGTELYDESEDKGVARLNSQKATFGEIYDFGREYKPETNPEVKPKEGELANNDEGVTE